MIKNCIQNTLTLLIGIGLSLLLAEFIVRTVMPQEVNSRLNIYQTDPRLKFKLQANASASLVDREFNVSFETNSHGFRGSEYPIEKTRGTCRVLVIGDSFSVGYGVDQEDTFSQVLEHKLNQFNADPENDRWQTINASVPAYSTYMYLEAIRRYAAKFNADMVIVGFFVGNDFLDLEHIRAIIENGYMVKWEAALPTARANKPKPENANPGRELANFYSSLKAYTAANSHLYILLRNVAIQSGLSSFHRGRKYKLGAYLTDSDSNRYDKVATYIGEMKQIVDAYGAALAFLIIPEIKQVYDHSWSAAVAQSGLAAHAFTREKPNDKLIAILKRHGIEYIDMLPILRKRQSERFYFQRDGHWNATGHLAGAEALFEHIRKKLNHESVAGEQADESCI